MIFTVIDVETTGFSPAKDRIVEIGIVQRDERGQVLREFETLVEPERDVSNTFVHGLSASDLIHAPTFDKVASSVWDFLTSSDIICAHNFQFDWRMLCAEFERLECRLPEVNSLCTLTLINRVEPHLPRKLDALCHRLDIPIEAHRALSDARATGELVSRYLEALDLEDLPEVEWPKVTFPIGGQTYSRSQPPPVRQPILTRLMERLPRHPGQSNLDEYYTMLDDVFADSILEDHEAESLVNLAGGLGLGKEQLEQAHHDYLAQLVRVAQQDGFVSEQERDHLNKVAKALGIDDINLRPLDSQSLYPRDLKGKRICITGELKGKLNGRSLSRKELEELVREHGMEWKTGVSKKLDFLVARDVHSKSTKAKKARAYGIPVVAEQVFWNWLGVQVR